MKRLSFFDKIIFVINSIFALALLIACACPFVPADEFPFISIFSLGVPILVTFNFLFIIYWLVRWKRQIVMSLTILTLGYFILDSFVLFGFSDDKQSQSDLKVMSFNVRSFNKYNAIDEPDIFEKTYQFIQEENPDVICFQEFDYIKGDTFKEEYPYRHLKYIGNNNRVILAIFSKHKIIDANTLDWPNTHNNGSYADILVKNDTIRVYNLHMESLQITASKESLVREAKPRLYKKLIKIFKKQSLEAKLFKQHRDSVDYNTIVCGDFNNTQFSNSYKVVKGNMSDTFLEKGSGLGVTYSFLGLPYRIDYILADPAFEVKSHKNYEVNFSDHFPVMASFGLQKE